MSRRLSGLRGGFFSVAAACLAFPVGAYFSGASGCVDAFPVHGLSGCLVSVPFRQAQTIQDEQRFTGQPNAVSL